MDNPSLLCSVEINDRNTLFRAKKFNYTLYTLFLKKKILIDSFVNCLYFIRFVIQI